METVFDLDTIQLFIVFVVPGLISMSVYRLLMPAHALDWSQAILQGLFYSSINFVLLLPLLAYITRTDYANDHAILYWFWVLVALFLAPVIWPLLLRTAFRWRWLASKVQIPYPTAWDYFFDLRQPVFVLVHLNTGGLIGGYWGRNSYAGSFPNDGDIYLEAIYAVNTDGTFGNPIPDTRGLLLRKDQYSYIELFAVPETG
jgi:hypothetical protein